MILTGCSEPASWEKLNNEAIDVTETDAMGDHSISILGDSISHGAASADIAHDSWVALFKEAVNAKTGDHNYGFTSVEGTLWGKVQSRELHAFPSSNCGFKDRGSKGEGWTEYRTAELLGTKGLGSSQAGDWLEFSPTEKYAYFCIYYQAGPQYGSFQVSGGDGEPIADVDGYNAVNCHAQDKGFARSAFYDASLIGDKPIRITAMTDSEIILTGIGYYDTPGGVVVNNYSNGGLQFAGTGRSQNGDVTGLDDRIVDFAATSGTVIFALGYNDAHFVSNYELFEKKIDHLIEKVNQNGTRLIVVNFNWNMDTGDGRYLARYPHVQTVQEQIDRLVEQTGAVYVDPQAIYGQKLFDTIADGAHPNAEGHRMIAQAVIDAVGITGESEPT